MKPSDLIQLLENPNLPNQLARDDQTEALLSLLVHMFVADRRLDDGELALMTRILPVGADPRAYIEELSRRPLDFDRLAALFPDTKDRDDIITLAEHAVWGDGEVDAREWDVIDQLVERLGVVRD